MNPPPEIRPLRPTPMMVLFDVTGISAPYGVTVTVALTRMTYDPLIAAYRLRSARSVTVTVVPPAPPVVPAAKPSALFDHRPV
jgi:hypothetical protein